MPLTQTPIEVLEPVWWVAAVAFGVSLAATPIARLVAYKTKIVDRPDDLLKPHSRPIAYLGGLAMCFGLLAGLAVYVAAVPETPWQWQQILSTLTTLPRPNIPLLHLMAIALACVLMTAMGLLDDIHSLKPRQKVCWQVAGAVVLLAGGVGDELINVLVYPLVDVSTLPVWLVLPCSGILCVSIVVGTCNATNLLDGLDGLCGGVTEIISLGFLALAVWLAIWHGADHPRHSFDLVRIVLCLSMAGAILGFLPYNIPPASIFMGDAGSMLLGFFVATMICLFGREGNARWVLAAFVVFSLPIADTGLAVVRRALMRKSIFAGDRSHLYDQLIDRGMSVNRVVLLFYVLATLAAVTGVTLAVLIPGQIAMLIYIGVAIVVWIIFWRLKMIKPPPRGLSPGELPNKSSVQPAKK